MLSILFHFTFTNQFILPYISRLISKLAGHRRQLVHGARISFGGKTTTIETKQQQAQVSTVWLKTCNFEKPWSCSGFIFWKSYCLQTKIRGRRIFWFAWFFVNDEKTQKLWKPKDSLNYWNHLNSELWNLFEFRTFGHQNGHDFCVQSKWQCFDFTQFWSSEIVKFLIFDIFKGKKRPKSLFFAYAILVNSIGKKNSNLEDFWALKIVKNLFLTFLK